MANREKAVFTIIETSSINKPIFRRIGVAYEQRDGSLSIFLDALPITGKLVVKEEDTEKKDGKSQ